MTPDAASLGGKGGLPQSVGNVPAIYRTPASALLADVDLLYKDTRERLPFLPAALSNALGGGLGAEFVLLKAPGGAGKTDLLLNIAVSAAKGGKVLISSREISKQACMRRAISCISCHRKGGMPLTEADIAYRDRASEEKAAEIEATLEEAKCICNNIVIVDDADMTNDADRHIEGLVTAVAAIKERDGSAPVVFLDYVQLLTTNQGAFSATDALDKISHALAVLAHRERTPVIAITTMGKDGSIRGTAQLKFDADAILDMHGLPKDPDSRATTVRIEKFRNGRADQEVELCYWPAYHFFDSVG